MKLCVKVNFVFILKVWLVLDTKLILNRCLNCIYEFWGRLPGYLNFFFHGDIFGQIFLKAFNFSVVKIAVESSYNLLLRVRRLEFLKIHPVLIWLTAPFNHVSDVKIVATPGEPFIQ